MGASDSREVCCVVAPEPILQRMQRFSVAADTACTAQIGEEDKDDMLPKLHDAWQKEVSTRMHSLRSNPGKSRGWLR